MCASLHHDESLAELQATGLSTAMTFRHPAFMTPNVNATKLKDRLGAYTIADY